MYWPTSRPLFDGKWSAVNSKQLPKISRAIFYCLHRKMIIIRNQPSADATKLEFHCIMFSLNWKDIIFDLNINSIQLNQLLFAIVFVFITLHVWKNAPTCVVCCTFWRFESIFRSYFVGLCILQKVVCILFISKSC